MVHLQDVVSGFWVRRVAVEPVIGHHKAEHRKTISAFRSDKACLIFNGLLMAIIVDAFDG
jgi:hypothetical protein